MLKGISKQPGNVFYIVVSVMVLLLEFIGHGKCAFCGTFPALAKKRSFSRDRAEKSDGTFDFKSKLVKIGGFVNRVYLANGNEHSIFGWFRISDKQ